MPTPYAGTVLKLHFKEKDIVKVGQVLVTIGEKGEALTGKTPEEMPVGAPAAAPSVVGVITTAKKRSARSWRPPK